MDDHIPRLLIVEDDPEIGVSLAEYFGMQGYIISRALDGEQAVKMMCSLPPFDIVMLDVLLPGKTGFEVLREARKAGVTSKVLVLTVKAREEDKLRGFSLGADDYVTKPFSVEELAARVRALLKRGPSASLMAPGVVQFGDIEVNLGTHSARKGVRAVNFTSLEFDILRYFIEHRGRTVSRKMLLRDVWGITGDVTTRTIDRHVASIRKKLEKDPAVPQFIETVYGIGYRFLG